MVKPPCEKTCEERSVTCHSDCAKYAQYVAKLEEQRKARKEQAQAGNDIMHVRRDKVIAIYRRYRRGLSGER